jgi:hypothetical protein
MPYHSMPCGCLITPLDTPCHKPLLFMLNLVSAKACYHQNIWTWTRFFLHLSRKKHKKTGTKQKMMVNKTKLKLKIVCKKKMNSIKGRLITYGLRTSSGWVRRGQVGRAGMGWSGMVWLGSGGDRSDGDGLVGDWSVRDGLVKNRSVANKKGCSGPSFL